MLDPAEISCEAGSAEGALGSVLELRKGADLMQLRKKRSLSFSSLLWDPELAGGTRNGQATSNGSLTCVYLNILCCPWSS